MKKYMLIAATIFSLSACTLNSGQVSELSEGKQSPKTVELEKPNLDITKEASINPRSEVIKESFKVSLTQFGGKHSRLQSGVYWPISSLAEPFPSVDSSIRDIGNIIKIEFSPNNYFLIASCPKDFIALQCSVDKEEVLSDGSSCTFYFSENGKNSNISMICSNGIFEPLL